MLLRHGTDYVRPDLSTARGILRRGFNSSGDPAFGGPPVLPGPNTFTCEFRLYVPRGEGPADHDIIAVGGESFYVAATRPHSTEWDRVELTEH